jgi:hypothetical protein
MKVIEAVVVSDESNKTRRAWLEKLDTEEVQLLVQRWEIVSGARMTKDEVLVLRDTLNRWFPVIDHDE